MASLEGSLPRRLKKLQQQVASSAPPCPQCGSEGKGLVKFHVLQGDEKARDFPCPSCGKHPTYFTVVHEEKARGGLE